MADAEADGDAPPGLADGAAAFVVAVGVAVPLARLLAVRIVVGTGLLDTTGGEGSAVAGAEGEVMTLTTGMAWTTPAFLSTTFAPNDATKTAITVPATQAERPTTTRIMSAI